MIKNLWYKLNIVIKLEIFKNTWKRRNNHNYTTVKNIFPIEKVSVGKYSYGPLNIIHFGNPKEMLSIGNYCSISAGVKFLLGGEHHPQYLMNFPLKFYLTPDNVIDDRKTKGPIIIEDDVWIGTDAIILSGVTIGQGAIIASGSVVAKNVPAYAIYTTNRIIKYRFLQENIDKLLKIDFSKFDEGFIKEHIELFYTSNIEDVLVNPGLLKYMKD